MQKEEQTDHPRKNNTHITNCGPGGGFKKKNMGNT